MSAAATSSSQVPAFSGWDELGPKGPSWKIEREEVQADALAPFFPDQNGRVYEQLLFNFPFMMHAMDAVEPAAKIRGAKGGQLQRARGTPHRNGG